MQSDCSQIEDVTAIRVSLSQINKYLSFKVVKGLAIRDCYFVTDFFERYMGKMLLIEYVELVATDHKFRLTRQDGKKITLAFLRSLNTLYASAPVATKRPASSYVCCPPISPHICFRSCVS